jgi:hypothetical protein
MAGLKMRGRPVRLGTRRPTQTPRLVHLLVMTLNSYLFGSPMCFDYRLAASSNRDARIAKGKTRHCWNSQSNFGSSRCVGHPARGRCFERD